MDSFIVNISVCNNTQLSVITITSFLKVFLSAHAIFTLSHFCCYSAAPVLCFLFSVANYLFYSSGNSFFVYLGLFKALSNTASPDFRNLVILAFCVACGFSLYFRCNIMLMLSLRLSLRMLQHKSFVCLLSQTFLAHSFLISFSVSYWLFSVRLGWIF